MKMILKKKFSDTFKPTGLQQILYSKEKNFCYILSNMETTMKTTMITETTIDTTMTIGTSTVHGNKKLGGLLIILKRLKILILNYFNILGLSIIVIVLTVNTAVVIIILMIIFIFVYRRF